MDEKRRDRLEGQIGVVREDLGSFKTDATRQFEKLREEIRLSRVVQEELRSEIQLVAEGVAGYGERLDQFQAEVRKAFQDLFEMLRPVYELMDPKYRELDRRVEVLEERDEDNREFLQGLRKRFGTR